MGRKTTLWILQGTNKQDLIRENLVMKPKKRN